MQEKTLKFYPEIFELESKRIKIISKTKGNRRTTKIIMDGKDITDFTEEIQVNSSFYSGVSVILKLIP